MHSWRKSGNLPWYMLIPCKKSRVNLTLLHPDPVSFLTIVPSDSCIRSCFCWIRVEIMRKVDCQKQTSNYHVSHFWTYEEFGKKNWKLTPYATCLCWTRIFSWILRLDKKQLQAQPTNDHGVKISKNCFMIFLLRVIISKSSGYSILYIYIYYINQTCFSFDRDHKGEMANSFPVLLNERQNRGQFSTVRTASDALPWLSVIRLTPRCYRMVPVLKRMIALCLGMIFANLVV